MALLAPDRKWRWKVMHMGSLNAAPKFLEIMMKPKIELDALAKKCGM